MNDYEILFYLLLESTNPKNLKEFDINWFDNIKLNFNKIKKEEKKKPINKILKDYKPKNNKKMKLKQ